MKIGLVEVAYYFGREGVSMGAGPARYVHAGAEDMLRRAGQDVRLDKVRLDASIADDYSAIVEVNRRVASTVRKAVDDGYFPLVLAGLCNTSIGVLAGVGIESTGIIWFDAHGDFNTPHTTQSGFLDGMALAIVTGRCHADLRMSAGQVEPAAEARVLLVAPRDLDPGERDNLDASQVTVIEYLEVRQSGLASKLQPTLEKLQSRTRKVYLHLDVDVLDHNEAPANKYSTPGGLSVSEVEAAIREIAQRFTIKAATLSAYDPTYDTDGKTLKAGIQLMRAIIESVDGGPGSRQIDTGQ
ncbi:MAG: arginase family protein [Chloroflexota bacterium]|nr:arginase family protein [Chloroflexota bacterium]MDQ5867070.1 arginase family protein [Chloroflexota bacterium]